MALVQVNRNPSRRDLAWFGVLFGAFFALFGWIAWRKDLPGLATGLWGAAAIVPALYYAIPPLRRPIYLGWCYLALPVGLVVSWVVLSAVYFLVVTPVGLALRLAGRDPLQRAFETGRASYWVEHRTGGDAHPYFRQY